MSRNSVAILGSIGAVALIAIASTIAISSIGTKGDRLSLIMVDFDRVFDDIQGISRSNSETVAADQETLRLEGLKRLNMPPYVDG